MLGGEAGLSHTRFGWPGCWSIVVGLEGGAGSVVGGNFINFNFEPQAPTQNFIKRKEEKEKRSELERPEGGWVGKGLVKTTEKDAGGKEQRRKNFQELSV